jgi:PAS domain-containing protein
MEVDNLHWMLSILQNMHNGLVVVDRQYRICMWNSFMENHSGQTPEDVEDRELFDVFPDVDREWLQHKIDTVFLVDCPAYTIWEERPYVFRFKNYRPITGKIDFMYQYSTLIPLRGLDTRISHVAILITDVTAIAVNKLGLIKANERLAIRP